MKLILIRHLPTPGNEKRQYIGRLDESLSAGAVKRFHKENREYPAAEYIVASPLKRCLETAELIYPGRHVYVDERLRECDFGCFEGRSYDQLKDEPAYQTWLDSGGTLAFPEGESQENFRERCVQGMKDQIRKLSDQKIQSAAFVVHGGTIMAVLDSLAEEKKGFYHWQVKNGEGYTAEVLPEEWTAGKEVLRKIRKL